MIHKGSNRKTLSPDGELSTIYSIYVAYECILINLVGFITLFFQCELQSLQHRVQDLFPNSTLTEWEWESLFGHYWLKDDLNCNTRSSHCLTYMVAGWLMIAGILQLFINFDNIRQKVFPNTNGDIILPKSIKLVCMYVFFVCDWYWVILMVLFRDVIGYQQIVGSAIDIAIRLVFVMNPDLMFKPENKNMATLPNVQTPKIKYHRMT